MKLLLAFVLCLTAVLAKPPPEKSGDSVGEHLVGCDSDATCGNGKKCNTIYLGLLREKKYKGACVPIKCDANGKCPTQGKPISGILSGRCLEDKVTCQYGERIAIA